MEVGVKPRTELRQPVGLSVLIHHPKVGEPLRFGFSMELPVRRCNKIDWLSVSSGRDRPSALGEPGHDHFGNVMLDVEHTELAGSGLKLGHRVTINDDRARAVCS